jgi:hypothetical protein
MGKSVTGRRVRAYCPWITVEEWRMKPFDVINCLISLDTTIVGLESEMDKWTDADSLLTAEERAAFIEGLKDAQMGFKLARIAMQKARDRLQAAMLLPVFKA